MIRPLRSATEALLAFADGSSNPEEYVEAAIRRIEDADAALKAWQWFDGDHVRLALRAGAREEGPRGLLHGIPIGVKDVFDTCDMPTGHGCAWHTRNRPTRDAAVVAELRRAGAIIMGKTACTELAFASPGPTVNPHASGHTPGGSSSGSAAAVAAGMVPIALGTQTAGSIIRPAAYCGVVGYKPSFGRISRAGVLALADSLDTVGVLSSTVSDAALVASVLMRRPDLRVASVATEPLRLGICRTSEWDSADAETLHAVLGLADRCAAAGASVVELSPPSELESISDAHRAIMAFEARLALAFEIETNGGRLSEATLDLIAEGEACEPRRYDQALSLVADARSALSRVFADCDVLIAPSAAGPAPAGLDSTGDPLFSRLWTALGLPCVQIPATTSASGLPIGVQLIGSRDDDRGTLAAAAWVEAILAQ